MESGQKKGDEHDEAWLSDATNWFLVDPEEQQRQTTEFLEVLEGMSTEELAAFLKRLERYRMLRSR